MIAKLKVRNNPRVLRKINEALLRAKRMDHVKILDQMAYRLAYSGGISHNQESTLNAICRFLGV
jgi:hypothetical protein